MPYLPTREEERAVLQQAKDVYVKVELLNKDFTVIDALTGHLIDDNFSMSSDNKQRRSYSCTLYVSDYSLTVGPRNKIWIDKYIRVYYGIRSIKTHEVFYWRIGTFTYVNADYSWSGTECTLSLTCADRMADFDGTKGGVINQNRYNEISGETAYGFKIPAVAEYEEDSAGNVKTDGYGNRIVKSYNKIADTVKALCNWAGITQYSIQSYPSGSDTIPYDMEYSGEVTYCQIWTDLCNLYPNWEFFFDVDGKFIWRKIPTGYGERVAIDDAILQKTIVSETTNNSFSGIYNVTEVWGKTFELTNNDRYAETSSYNSSTNTYTIKLSLVKKEGATDNTSPLSYFVNGDRIAFKVFTRNASANPKLIVQSTSGTTLATMPIVDSGAGSLPAGTFTTNSNGTICVVTFRANMGTSLKNCVYLNGKTQAYGIYEEKSKNCPFSTTNLGYKIVKRISKEKLFSDDLCYNQAEYETYYTTAMMDTITLTSIIIPWLTVNEKVQYTSQVTGKTEQYIIKSISWNSMGGTMSLNMYRFLEDFQYVYDRRVNG